MHTINYLTPDAPEPAGRYAQAAERGGIIAVAGQVGISPITGQIIRGVEGQIRQAMDNLVTVLAASGSSLEEVVQIRAYLTDPDAITVFNLVYEEYVTGETVPARATVCAALTHPHLKFEIEALAVRTAQSIE
jgi:reactive intermediate/imine deaminase